MSLEVSPSTGFEYLFKNVNDNMYEKANNPMIFAVLIAVIIVYAIVFNYLGVTHEIPETIKSGPGVKMFELLLWAVFLFLIFVNALQYFFEIDFKASISDLFGNNPQVKLGVSPNKSFEDNLKKKEVFHIGDNIYTYGEAKVICEAHDGELASYEQLESAYEKGAEWCSYGWSKDQMALYPTQKKTYNKLKNDPTTKNNCGRPGINGGYIANKNARFGVNCFASKNKPSDVERREMDSTTLPSVPMSKENKKLDFYKRNIHKIVKKPFNSAKWSSF
tara:strand:+ start:2289 stop:3116 length:828 start_codon:yes stop_codon:yes gene_type:complete